MKRKSPFLYAIPTITFALGCWQAYRLKWKLDLIEQLNQKFQETKPLTISSASQLHNLPEFTRVQIHGSFVNKPQFPIGPRTNKNESGQGGGVFSSGQNSGYYIVSPFKFMGTSDTILVNRGFVPRKWSQPELKVIFP